MPSPAELRAAAHALRSHAMALPTRLDTAARVLASDIWRGAGADMFEIELIGARVGLTIATADLVRAAVLLDLRAAALDDVMTGGCGG